MAASMLLRAYAPLTSVGVPRLSSTLSSQVFIKFSFFSLISSMLLHIRKLNSFLSKAFLWYEATLLEEKIIGVQISNIPLFSSVLMISSKPIPLRSPQVIPIVGFSRTTAVRCCISPGLTFSLNISDCSCKNVDSLSLKGDAFTSFTRPFCLLRLRLRLRFLFRFLFWSFLGLPSE